MVGLKGSALSTRRAAKGYRSIFSEKFCAKVLGENDDKNTNVDRIQLAEDDADEENKIDLNV